MARSRSQRRRPTSRRHRGGALTLAPAAVNDTSMLDPSKLNSAQGMDYMRIHQGQHGGASLAAAAPVYDQGLLDSSLRASARVDGLDASLAAASGMKDQSGGRRKGRSLMKMLKNSYRSTKKLFKGNKSFKKMINNSYRSTRKSLSLKKLFKGKRSLGKMVRNSYRSTKKALSLKGLKKMMRMRGGAGYQYANQADYSSPGTLLPPSMEAKALAGMNPEWSLDVRSFMPKM